jgi:hypothetical protein
MEYGIFTSTIRELPADPRSACAGDWMDLLPPGELRAIYFGSEFCEDLLPEAAAAESFCRWAVQEGVEAVLLTPVVTPNGLARVDRLLRALEARDLAPAVLFNDWGVLNLLRRSYPEFSRRAGRLMNRGLRDPRLLANQADKNNRTLGGGRLRSLLVQYGVEALETDPDLEGSYLGEKSPGLQRVLHFPYVFAATGRNCLVKADGSPPEESFTKGLGHPCGGLCRGRSHQFRRVDTGFPLWRGGNTIFYEVSQAGAKAHLAQVDRIVVYERASA